MFQVKYQSKNAQRKDRKSDVVDRELAKIHQQQGEVTPEVVLDQARSPKHPLHPYFEWDDTVAALKHRLNQARELIAGSQFLVLLLDARTTPPRVVEDAEVAGYLKTRGNNHYKKRAVFMVDSDNRANYVEQKLSALRAWCTSVIDVPELERIRKGVLRLLPK